MSHIPYFKFFCSNIISKSWICSINRYNIMFLMWLIMINTTSTKIYVISLTIQWYYIIMLGTSCCHSFILYIHLHIYRKFYFFSKHLWHVMSTLKLRWRTLTYFFGFTVLEVWFSLLWCFMFKGWEISLIIYLFHFNDKSI